MTLYWHSPSDHRPAVERHVAIYLKHLQTICFGTYYDTRGRFFGRVKIDIIGNYAHPRDVTFWAYADELFAELSVQAEKSAHDSIP